VSERLIPLGEIVTTHGLDGWVKINPYNPQTSALSPSVKVHLEKAGTASEHELEAVRPHQGRFLIKLRNIDCINEAERWIGSKVSVAEEALQLLGPHEYYHYQVVGFDVFDLRGKRVGTVERVWSTAAGELYVVAGEAKEHLIPAVKEIVENVDLVARTIIINPPEGLLDL
jgi:16S rRNA processing protein RimM